MYILFSFKSFAQQVNMDAALPGDNRRLLPLRVSNLSIIYMGIEGMTEMGIEDIRNCASNLQCDSGSHRGKTACTAMWKKIF